ncbi:MAG: RHS repeat-associated core domain-containing protein, partial [Alphaproteobacteria bacterium]|nr:RHS repeat-associated core domain-containing protein [Alphaproteobacteria bacterium]
MGKKYYFCTVKTATKYKIFGSPRWDGACFGPFRCTFFAKNHNGQSSKQLFPKERTPFSSYYTFTGKELDSETGYSYFGARYYDAELSGLFFSVDPMVDKYPSNSPYAYCAWNPVKLVDPDGEDPVFLGLLEYYGKAKYGNSHVGETQKIGNFYVVPFYDNTNNLIGYN